MSDRGASEDIIRDLSSAIRNLSIAAETLSSRVAGSAASSSADPDWEVIEEEASPYPALARDLGLQSCCRNIEDGPLPTPPACFDLARRRLSSVSVGPDRRATRAFRAGFWASASILTHTPYQVEDPLPDLKIGHWVVLRSSRTPPAFRVTSKAAFVALTQGETDLVFESFASLAEVQIFCLGAQAPVPSLLQCKKQM